MRESSPFGEDLGAATCRSENSGTYKLNFKHPPRWHCIVEGSARCQSSGLCGEKFKRLPRWVVLIMRWEFRQFHWLSPHPTWSVGGCLYCVLRFFHRKRLFKRQHNPRTLHPKTSAEQCRVGAEKAVAFETPTEGGRGWNDEKRSWGVRFFT